MHSENNKQNKKTNFFSQFPKPGKQKPPPTSAAFPFLILMCKTIEEKGLANFVFLVESVLVTRDLKLCVF